MTNTTEQAVAHDQSAEKMCADHDEDCPGVACKTTCWLYQPERGFCPYLKDDAKAKLTTPQPTALLDALKVFVWPYQEGCRLTDTEKQDLGRAAIEAHRNTARDQS